MEITPFLLASLLLCCALSPIVAAQQIQSRDLASQPPITRIADRFKLFVFTESREPAKSEPTVSSLSAREALRRRLLSVSSRPLSEQISEQSAAQAQSFV